MKLILSFTHQMCYSGVKVQKEGSAMTVIDLTHTIEETMPVYPGTQPPWLETVNTYEKDFFKETLISMFSHTGTHMDPPAHIFPEGKTLDQFPPEQFIIENLKGLHLCGNDLFSFSCFPLKLADADGSPVRAAAWFE